MIYLKLKALLYLFILLFFIIPSISFSQNFIDQDNFITLDKDLTQRSITSIINDDEGYLWIGTYGSGLFKYNGVDFINYKQDQDLEKNALNSSIINSIFVDKQNRLWIGTNVGVNWYNEELDRFESIDLGKKIDVYVIEEYNKDTLLIGSYQHGLIKLNKNDFKIELIQSKEIKSFDNLSINAIIKTQDGRFFIGTDRGLMTIDPFKELLQFAKFDAKIEYREITNVIQSLHLAKDNSIWIGTKSSGVYRIDENDNGLYNIEAFPISDKRILSIAEKADNTILLGTENDGLFEINYNSGKIKNHQHDKLKPNSIKSNSIWTVFVDEKNRIWLGYYHNSIDVNDELYNKFEALKSEPYEPSSLFSSSVTGIVKDEKGRLWISMQDGGIDVFDPTSETFINLFDQNNPIAKGLNRLDINSVFIDSKNNVWVGTWDSGLYLLKHNQKKFININSSSPSSVFKSNRIMCFDEDSKGTVWIGAFTEGGLYSYNPINEKFTCHNSEVFRKHQIDTRNIRKVLIDMEDNIWVGSMGGLFKVKKHNDTVYEVTSLNKKMGAVKNPSEVVSLYQDETNNLWIGTFERGLFKFDIDKDTIKWYNSNNGLIHETISSIIQDTESNLWIGGNKGLSKFNIEKEVFTNFNKKDGLLSNYFNFNAVYKSADNILYFGNTEGINYFNPDNINYNKEKPNIHFTDFKILDESVQPNTKDSSLKYVFSKTENITLNHNQSTFTIQYVNLNFTRSENNQYAYYLEGYEKVWNYVGTDRSATYKNIPPGNYSFIVKASNNDGLWSETPKILNIKIRRAWWATNVAIASYVLLTLILISFIKRSVKIRIKERRALNYERQEHKQFEILNAKKLQFFTNISHEFRTPLTLILTPIEDIIEQKNEQLSIDLREKHNVIYKNAKRLSRLINELMDFSKLQANKMNVNASKINIIPFIEEIVNHYAEEAKLKNIMLSIEYIEDDIVIWADPTMIEKIIFNLLSNAFKATPEFGLVTIQVNKSQKSVSLPLVNADEDVSAIEIIIKDSGIGLKEENLNKVFDRFYQAHEMDNQYYGGTGIGLELVKRFVDLHKGKIVLTSEENIGTEFKIYFPLDDSTFKEGNISENNKKTVNQYSEENLNEEHDIDNKESINKKTILIVEDNIELRAYLKNELKDEYCIKEAENGLQGLEKANEFLPDIIITDVMMPVMDGFEFCVKIKTDLRTSHIPLLMLTAKGMQIDRIEGIDSGADIYLNKPFNMKVLRSHLNQLISSRQILFNKYFTGTITSVDSDNITSLDKEFMNNVINYINENISDENLNVENLAGELFLSRSKLYRKIKALTGNTATEFIRKVRLEKAKELIENSDNTITIAEISYKVGFSSPSYFSKCFKDAFDIIPTEIRSKH